MKRIAILMMVAILSVGMAIAATPGEVAAGGLASMGQYASSADGNIAIASGDVYDVTLTASVSTFVWTAITGLVGGDIVLGTGTGTADWLYKWAADGRMVYAAEANTVNWSFASIQAAVLADVVAGAPEVNTNAADDWNATFLASANPDSAIYSGLNALYVDTYDSAEANTWRTFSLVDTAGILVWAGEVQEGGELFDGTPGDFQILLPEDGRLNDVATTTYYLWAELV